MNRQLVRSSLGALLVSLVLSVKALAMPITGVINFAGGATLNDADITAANTVVSWANPVAVTSATGDFAGITQVNLANNWQFDPSSAVVNFWTGGIFSFDLSSSVRSVASIGGTPFLNVEGVGVLHAAGFDATPGFFSFSTQGNTGLTTISFSSTLKAPDGGTTALLLGLGLTGIALIARRQRKAV